jgi:GT2 family glycosyltransferase
VTEAVSIVIPALGPGQHFAWALEALGRVLELRAGLDEVLVMDDSGRGDLESWVRTRIGGARVLALPANGGFARALHAGLEAARNELVFCMNSDLAPRAGFLEPLIAALHESEVFSATPRVLRAELAGDGETCAQSRIESLTSVQLEGGRARAHQPCIDGALPREPGTAASDVRTIAFGLGGACLLRRSDYFALGGLDALFEPFYLEDLDLGWRAWRAGRRCLHVSESVCLHLNQATIAAVAPRELVAAAIEKNQWLFEWKHLDGDELELHLAALDEVVLDAWLMEDRRALEGLALALEQTDSLLAARRAQSPAVASFRELARRSDPFGPAD